MPNKCTFIGLILITTLQTVYALPLSAAKPVKRVSPAAASRASVPESAICTSLTKNYEDASKQLALNEADDAVDDSAARATMRQAQNTNTLASAQMTMNMMRDNACKLPTFAPSAARYGLASLRCSTAKQRIRAQIAHDRLNDHYVAYDSPKECDVETWTPDN